MSCPCPACASSEPPHTFPIYQLCIECKPRARASMLLACLPSPNDFDKAPWKRLPNGVQTWLQSVREQFEQTGDVSTKQLESLERIWDNQRL